MYVTSARAVNCLLKDKGSIYQWRTQKEEKSADSFVWVSRNTRMHDPQLQRNFCYMENFFAVMYSFHVYRLYKEN